jgi:hypothetical protein
MARMYIAMAEYACMYSTWATTGAVVGWHIRHPIAVPQSPLV